MKEETTKQLLEKHAKQQREVMLEGMEEKDADWRLLPPKTIRDNMWEEIVKLYEAFEAGDQAGLEKAAADVSNYAMMLSWKVRHDFDERELQRLRAKELIEDGVIGSVRDLADKMGFDGKGRAHQLLQEIEAEKVDGVYTLTDGG